MKTQAYQIANIFGLDVSNKQHSIAIADALNNIDDPSEFVQFCRDHKDGIEYVAKTEKLDILATRYKKHQEEKALEKQYIMADRFSRQLADKVKSCRNFVEENDVEFHQIAVDGHSYFTEKEKKALSGVGSKSVIIELSRTNELLGEIQKLYISKAREAMLPKAKQHSRIELKVKRF